LASRIGLLKKTAGQQLIDFLDQHDHTVEWQTELVAFTESSDGVVATLAWTETISWGVVYYAFSVFLRPIQAELGWSQVALTGAFSLALLLSGIAAIPVGRLLDTHRPRLLMTFGSCAAALLVPVKGESLRQAQPGTVI